MCYTRAMTKTVLIALILSGMAIACGNVSPDPPVDATDADAGDTAVDTATDLPVDTLSDSPVDSPSDTVPDIAEDDVVLDTTPEVLDVPEWDIPEDWPTDIPEDWPYPTAWQCTTQGGFCSGGISLPCPAGYEPLSASAHRHCDANGWCCIPAAYSPCSESGTGNCMPAVSCAMAEDGCWTDPAAPLECEAYRVCCENAC